MRKIKTSALLIEYAPYMALALLLIICCISSPGFRKPQNLLNITRQVSYSGIIALGMTFVIIGGGIDLSVGSLLALSGTLGIMTMLRIEGIMTMLRIEGIMTMLRIENPMTGLLVAAAVALCVGFGGGAVNGLLVNLGKVPPFIATLGTMSIFRSLTLQLTNAGTLSTSNSAYGNLGSALLCRIPLPTLTLFVLTALGSVLLYKTRFGRHACALGSNERVARYAAINTPLVSFWTYALTGLLTGLSGFLLGGRLCSISSTTAGLGYELDAIAAAIIGGTSMSGGRGSLAGTLVGVLILGIISNVLVMWGVSANLQDAVKGIVIVAAVLMQPRKK